MPNSPPAALVQLLEQLGLATSGQIASVAPAVRRLAGELPEFESVWIDALAQRRLLTPFQASWLSAGRGSDLRIGPYVLRQRLLTPAWAESYRAAHHETKRTVELLIVRAALGRRPELLAQSRQLIEQLQLGSDGCLLELHAAGECKNGVWFAVADWQGKPVADWIAEHGRFPSEAVLHIARETLAALNNLYRLKLLHTGLSAQSLVIDGEQLKLRHSGLRSLARPLDGYSLADLPPCAYEGVSPERIAKGGDCDLASEIFAFGSLLWHLLTGRPPFAGGNALTKLRSIHDARLGNLQQLAPDAPDTLIRLTVGCLARQLEQRPKSFEEISALLGPETPQQRKAFVAAIRHPRGLYRYSSPRSGTLRARLVASTAAGACLIAIFAAWPSKRPATPLLIPRNPVALALAPTQKKANDARPLYDPQVRVVSATEPVEPTAAIDPVLLPIDHVVELAGVELQDGQVVQASKGGRSIVRVPRDGLLVTAENVRFENVDFVWDASTPAAREVTSPSLIALQARRCEFRRCTFQSSGQAKLPAAIDWQAASEGSSAEDLPAELVLSNCHFSGLAAVVFLDRRDSCSIDVSNTLLTRCEAACRLAAFPELGSTFSLSLEHVTLRDHGSLVVIPANAQSQPGQVVLRAGGSVLALRDGEPLIALVGSNSVPELLPFLRWQGEGSLLLPETPIAAWQRPSGLTRPLGEEQLSVAGLVRGDVDFASDNPLAAASSRVTSWQAPLRSSQPPGILSGVPDLPLVP
jgi:eukaryotic-like serine/threonine-protein kinase